MTVPASPSLEVRLALIEEDLREVLELLNGGAHVSYERSVRGQLHYLRGRDAAMKLVAKQRRRALSTGERLIVAACALLAIGLQAATLAVGLWH